MDITCSKMKKEKYVDTNSFYVLTIILIELIRDADSYTIKSSN